ncbi:alkaline phosphatase D family protein [Halalkalibacter akibai]|uniref:Uncharacterized protein n=1 Tax=Halalkalibacter akibai (strain ATCC 43226 / DSM 21942 / CIP 109018 / JCM 9157 / 1139) TaxID=1236973 RepID=W4QNU8_HALA3|nr:alkaline phosphatase D family protein [Halalkalibacter akibai]GAE33756.1 hypothetical protein JCM9157_780 [Halalkalibacter akibai JCM 9157]
MNSFQFPPILAGPIIRRVEPTSVSIWVATSKNFSIKERIYHIINSEKENQTEYQLLTTESETNTVQMGENLFIHMITASPLTHSFPINQLLGYNLQFTNDRSAFDLGDLDLLNQQNPHSIVYGDLKYPSFYINDFVDHTHILYGSCRKLHGEGEDRLARADDWTAEHSTNLKKRPQSLFLMGDQIYADDVADPVIRVISAIGEQLIGRKESLREVDERVQHKPYQSALNQIKGRQAIAKDLCQFTSSHADNHLIQLGEFVAMYLLSWSPELWDVARDLKLFESFDEALENKHIFLDEGALPKLTEKKMKKRFNKQLHSLFTFIKQLPKVRRVLANTPTYMMFDDHEITDDWNLSSAWQSNVKNAPLGKHVVANGLTAYWAFQGWGNQPKQFEGDFISTLQAYCHSLMNGSMMKDHNDWTEVMWNFQKWHFIAPTMPRAVFLDTRTQRKLHDKIRSRKLANLLENTPITPQLVDSSQWDDLSKQLFQSGWKQETPLMIVSAVPFYGLGLVESFLKNYVLPLKAIGLAVDTRFDLEAWKFNNQGFTHFLQQVAYWDPDPCIILSGDAHYASSVSSDVSFPDGQKISMKQFTSSPLKNKSFTSIWGILLKNVIDASSQNHEQRKIYRYCDESYEVKTFDDKEEFEGVTQVYVWKDQLRYQAVSGNSLIETDNNLGLLAISGRDVKSQLLIE